MGEEFKQEEMEMVSDFDVLGVPSVNDNIILWNCQGAKSRKF